MSQSNKNNFNLQTFLSALGAGGLSVAPFAYMQYNFPHNDGLVTFSGMLE